MTDITLPYNISLIWSLSCIRIPLDARILHSPFNFHYLAIMADALNLAVNIFTLLEFAKKFVHLAVEIHKDGEDAVRRIASLDLTSQDLDRIASELSQPDLLHLTYHEGQPDERIQQLAMRCSRVSSQMQETISELRTPRINRRGASGVAIAFKYKWRESGIVAFQSEIEDLRNELMLNLILWIRCVLSWSLRVPGEPGLNANHPD